MEEILEGLHLEADFLMLAPETDRYVLYIRSEQLLNGFNDKVPDKLEDKIDEKLRANFHYDYCRRLGQLKSIRVFQTTGRPEREYLEECVKRGQRLGDIKPVALHLQGGWHRVFQGNYL